MIRHYLLALAAALALPAGAQPVGPLAAPPPPGPALEPETAYPLADRDDLNALSLQAALDLVARAELSNGDIARVLIRAAEDGTPAEASALWTVADALRLVDFGKVRMAFYALLQLDLPHEALVEYAETRIEPAVCGRVVDRRGDRLRLTIATAIGMASIRPDSSVYLRVATLADQCSRLGTIRQGYEGALQDEARWAASPPEEAAYEMARRSNSFGIPSGRQSHGYFGPIPPAWGSSDPLVLHAASALSRFFERSPPPVYAAIDRYVADRMASLTASQRRQYSSYRGRPLAEAIRAQVLAVADIPEIPTCSGAEATVFVSASGLIVGGPDAGQPYTGTLRGTAGADVMVGTAGDDTLLGLDGDDVLCGLDGDDTLDGGEGSDACYGAVEANCERS